VTAFSVDNTGPLPFPPGESPFHVKGTVYRGHLEWVAQKCPGGMNAMNAEFRDPRLAPYLARTFLASSWYDIIPVITSAYVVARLTRMSFGDFMRMRTRIQAESDLGGIYRLLLQLATPSQVVSRYAAVQTQYFDFGTSTGRLVDKKIAEVERKQVPALFVDWFTTAHEAFLEVAVGRSGARDVRVTSEPPALARDTHGLAAVDLKFTITWA
jgi:hypothetical protein